MTATSSPTLPAIPPVRIPAGTFPELCLSFFSAAAFLCCAAFTLPASHPKDFYAWYTMAILFFAFAGAAYSFVGTAAAPLCRFPAKYLAIFFLGLLLGLFRLSYFSVWLDEELQVHAATDTFASIVQQASYTQMPLSYFFTALNLSVAGFNEWGVRLFPCLFYAGSAALFSCLVDAVCTSRFVRAVAPAAYLLQPWLVRYAQEGRPYAGMLFCALLWLNLVRSFFLDHTEQRAPHRWPALLSSTLLLFLSIGFQPIVFVVSFLPAACALGFSARWRKRSALFFLAVIAATVAVLPLILLMMRSARPYSYLQTSPSLDFVRLSAEDVASLFSKAYALGGAQLYVFFLVLAVTPVLCLARSPRGERPSLGASLLGITAATCVFFVLFFWFLFSLFVHYALYVRYFLIIYPLGLLVVFLFLDNLPAFRAPLYRTLLPMLRGALALALMAPELSGLPAIYAPDALDRWNPDYRSLYQFLRRSGSPGDLAYVIPYQEPRIWEQTGFLSSRFYYREGRPVALRDMFYPGGAHTATDLILHDLDGKVPQHLFLVFVETSVVLEELLQKNPRPDLGLVTYSGTKFFVARITVEKSVPRTLMRFLETVVRASNEKAKAYRMFDILMSLAEREKDSPRCLSYLNELKATGSDAPVILEIERNHSRTCGDRNVRELRE